MTNKISSFIFLALYSTWLSAAQAPLVLTADETKNWAQQSGSLKATLTSLTRDNQALVAVGQLNPSDKNSSPAAFISQDNAKTWKVVPINIKNLQPLKSIFKNGNQLIAVGSGPSIITSSDNGQHWTQSPTPVELNTKNSVLKSISGNETTLIVVGQYLPPPWLIDSVAAMIISKDQGKTWNLVTTLPQELIDTRSSFNSVQWDGKQWLATGNIHERYLNKGFIIKSFDGVNWTYANVPAVIDVNNLAFNNNLLLAIASTYNSKVILSSTDNGLTWKNSSNLPKDVYDLKSLNWNGQEWVAVGAAYAKDNSSYYGILPLILHSKDGLQWTASKLPLHVLINVNNSLIPSVNDVLWNNNQWVAVGVYNQLAPGCESFTGNWSGKLTFQSSQIIVTQLGFNYIFPKNNNNTYEYSIGSGAINYIKDSGTVGEGLGGTCIEKDGVATLNVFNNNPSSTARLIARKNFDADEITIIESNLSKTNYTGTLKRSY